MRHLPTRKWILVFGLIAAMGTACSFPQKYQTAGNDEGFQSWSEDNRGVASDGSPTKCANRVKEAGCSLSNNNFDRIGDNVESCKQVKSGSGKTTLELFLLRKSDKLVVIKTAGDGVSKPNCPVIKYTMDNSGISEIKVINNKVFMLAKSGRVYFMHADQSVYELLNSKQKSYSSVTDIKGSQGGNAIVISGNGFSNELTNDDLQRKIGNGEVRKLSFFTTYTDRSLFRDE